jgi:hypothetical protein
VKDLAYVKKMKRQATDKRKSFANH